MKWKDTFWFTVLEDVASFDTIAFVFVGHGGGACVRAACQRIQSGQQAHGVEAKF